MITLPEPYILFWIGSIVLLVLVLLVLIEIHRNNERREHEVMFGSDDFERRCRDLQLSEKEQHTMEKLVRRSVYSNKDALFNSANLFEDAVNRFYEFRNIDRIRDITLDSVTGLRRKLGFSIANPDTPFISTRQFEPSTAVKIRLENGMEVPVQVTQIDEKSFKVRAENPLPPNFERGQKVAIRWIRPGDAIYTAKATIVALSVLQIEFSHEVRIDKFQLRRWVRESVDFLAAVDYGDNEIGMGRLLDLSAGGILVGLEKECAAGSLIHIDFELPSYGRENVEIRVLRNLQRKNETYPDLILHSAEFAGEFGWTQEKVLQYLFELKRQKDGEKKR